MLRSAQGSEDGHRPADCCGTSKSTVEFAALAHRALQRRATGGVEHVGFIPIRHECAFHWRSSNN